MSLVGESLTQGKRSPMQSLTKLCFAINSPDGTAGSLSLLGYTGAFVSYVSSDHTIVVDLPTKFNNLYAVNVNPEAQAGSAMLMYELAQISISTDSVLADNLGAVVWFNTFTGTAPALQSDHTRVWFVCVKDDGTAFLPNAGLIYVELGISDNSAVGVAP